MEIIGHERIVQFLKRLVEEQSFIHGLLFFGPSEVGKRTVAMSFIRGKLCRKTAWNGCGACEVCNEFNRYQSERDFLEVKPEENGSIGIPAVRTIISFLGLQPQLSSRKAVLIDGADRLTVEAQNALLKTLEEPSGDTFIILVASKPGRLFETVRSRLVPIRFHHVSAARAVEYLMTRGAGEEDARDMARFAAGRIGRAIAFFEDEKRFAFQKELLRGAKRLEEGEIPHVFSFARTVAAKEASSEAIEVVQVAFREYLLEALKYHDDVRVERLARSLRMAQWAMTALEDTNVSERLLLENLFLSLSL